MEYQQTATYTITADAFKNFTCSGKNKLGETTKKIELRKATKPAKPNVPTATPSYSYIELKWDAPESLGIPITAYKVVYVSGNKDPMDTTSVDGMKNRQNNAVIEALENSKIYLL